MTTASDATRGGAVRLLAEAGVRALRMATAFLLVAGLGATGFGVYAALWGVAVLVAEATDLGLRTMACPAVAAGRVDVSKLVRTKVWMVIATFTVLAALAAAVRARDDEAAPLLLLAMTAAAVLITVAELGGVMLRGLGRRMEEAAVLLVMAACTLGGIAWIVGAPATGDLLRAVAGVHAGGALLAVALAAWWLWRAPRSTTAGVGPWAILAESLPLGLNGALALATMRIEILFLFLWRGPLETGFFAAALKLLEALNAVPGALAAGALPALTREGRGPLVAARRRTTATVLLLAAPTALMLGLVAPRIAPRMGYGGSILPLRILAVAVVPMFLNAAALHTLLAAGRGLLLPRLTAVRLLAAAVLAIVLIPRFGGAGAAAGLAASEWLLLALALRTCRTAGVEIAVGSLFFRRVSSSPLMVERAHVG